MRGHVSPDSKQHVYTRQVVVAAYSCYVMRNDVVQGCATIMQ